MAAAVLPAGMVIDLDELEVDMRPPDASALSAKQLVEELERRGLKPTGFPEDDQRLLQREFDKEFEAERAERIKARAEALARKRAEEEALKLQRFLERQKREEDEAVAEDKRVAFWIDLLRVNASPADMVLRVDPVAVRAFVKCLGTNVSLRALDLANSNLQDDVGVELGKALVSNTSISRVDLDHNRLGPKSLVAICEALHVNTTLRSLSLERNPLTGEHAFHVPDPASIAKPAVSDAAEGHATSSTASLGSPGPVASGKSSDPDSRRDYSGIAALGEALATTSTLLSLNLFHVGLGARGGKLLSEAMRKNTTLLTMQLSPTDGVTVEDHSIITDVLRDNNRMADEAKAAGKAARAAVKQAEAERRKIEEEAAVKAAEEAWVVAQKEARQKAREDAEYKAYAEARKAELDRETAERERIAKAKAEAEAKEAKKKKAAEKKKK